MLSPRGETKLRTFSTAARQNSLSRHAFTAVIIKASGDARYSAFCLSNWPERQRRAFPEWKVAAPWRLLPEGIRFDPNLVVTSPTLNFANTGNNPGLPAALPSINFRGQTVDLSSDAAFQVFAPDGTLTKGAPLRLRLLEGAEDAGSGIMYTGQQSGGEPLNYYDIVLLRETGQAKVERP